MKKSKAIILSLMIFISWWIIVNISMYLGASINLSINGIGGEGEKFILYYYLLVLLITGIIYLIIITLFFKEKDNRKIYIKMLKININKSSLIYLFILALGVVLGYIIWGELYGVSKLRYIYSIQPPIVEEILFRGLILSILSKAFSKNASIIISSVLFGFIHIMLSPINVIGTIFIGIIYCIIVIRTNSILPTIFMHYIQGINLYQLILGLGGICIYEKIRYFTKNKSISM